MHSNTHMHLKKYLTLKWDFTEPMFFYIHLLHTAHGSSELWGPVWQLLLYYLINNKEVVKHFAVCQPSTNNIYWWLANSKMEFDDFWFLCLCVWFRVHPLDGTTSIYSPPLWLHKPLYSITNHIVVCVSETFGLQKERGKGFSHLGELAPLNNGVTGLKTAKQSVH